jgi:hypothetical protein
MSDPVTDAVMDARELAEKHIPIELPGEAGSFVIAYAACSCGQLKADGKTKWAVLWANHMNTVIAAHDAQVANVARGRALRQAAEDIAPPELHNHPFEHQSEICSQCHYRKRILALDPDATRALEEYVAEKVNAARLVAQELIFYAQHRSDCAQSTKSEREIACSCGLTQLKARLRAAAGKEGDK